MGRTGTPNRPPSATGPLLLLSGADDVACPSTVMARIIVDRMKSYGQGSDVRHLDFPQRDHVVVRPWRPGQVAPTPFDDGGTVEALDAAHDVALPAVVRHFGGDLNRFDDQGTVVQHCDVIQVIPESSAKPNEMFSTAGVADGITAGSPDRANSAIPRWAEPPAGVVRGAQNIYDESIH